MELPIEPASLAHAQSTVLAQRSTVDVISDLKRKLHHPNGPFRRLDGGAAANPESLSTSLLPNQETPRVIVLAADNLTGLDDEDEDFEDGDDAPEGEEATTRPKRISERKRRLNAIADSWVQTSLLNPTEENRQVTADEEGSQSTKWLVNQSEDRVIATPREYQIELYERAKGKNIIAVLDTGSGKTCIAVLLLKHILAQELEDRAIGKQKRVAFFLVDSVTLVFQQHAVLKANIAQPMDMFCGDMGTNLWKRNRWEDIFDKNMIIVCTAEVLRQCLHHSYVSMDRINLLIFDEAHHAKKDHPYARIIKDFYLQAPKTSTLPKVFGMTASPVDARVDPKKAAAELEALLHCEIATAADTTLLQFAASSCVEEQASYYAPLRIPFETPLFSQINNLLKDNKVMRKALLFAFDATRELGAWCSDEMWHFCLEEEELKKLKAKTERKYLEGKNIPLEVLHQQQANLEAAGAMVKAHVFEPPYFRDSEIAHDHLASNLSSKVHLLVAYLRERFKRPTDDKCIVFVKQRYTARLISQLLLQNNVRINHLFVGTLVGTRVSEVGDINSSFRDQVVTMMKFRKGVLNCLIATSVAEEGLDIPDCNMIIRFDLYDTLIQYIQSRGRARHKHSKYIHMMESGNLNHRKTVREVRLNEGILKTFCMQLPEDRKLTGNDFNMDHFLAKERTHRNYTVPKTGAKLTYKSSLGVLANFVDSLPRGPDINLHAEYVVTVQSKQFIGEVILPEESPIRGAVGRPASTKQVAKCSAAFETCLLLIKGKYLDDRLLPIYAKQLPVMRNALLAVDSKKREAYDMRTKPKLWAAGEVGEELFMSILKLDTPESLDRPSQPLALLTRSPIPGLPSFPLHFGEGRRSLIQCIGLCNSLKVSAKILAQINAFTLGIFEDIFSKVYESNTSTMPYFLAPLKDTTDLDLQGDPSDMLAWETLEEVYQHQLLCQTMKVNEFKTWQEAPDDFFKDKYIVDVYDGSRKFWCKGLAPQYKPLDPVPADCPSRKAIIQRKTHNIMDYSNSMWGPNRNKLSLDVDQRVFEAVLIPLRRNLLDEMEAQADETPKRCFLIMEILKISALPHKVVSMAYLFPAIIHRIEAYLVALEACELLKLEIRPDLALEALTKDSDNSGDHDAEKINFQRGMGNNYERLEFLGDCFLKMATSISLYGTHPEHDEYAYHVDRMMLICNKNLCTNAIKLKLYEYIRSQSFNRRAWYPEGLVLVKGKTAKAPTSHALGDKSIADVCEALIGAALLSTDDPKNMDKAVRAVTELVCSENHNIASWSDYYKLYKKPAFQTKRATEMQKDLARLVEQQHDYRFQWPRLLRSAFIHPSFPYAYEQIPNYQRLEFLGDALLDMACINYLFHQYPGKDPQWLTEHKMAMVSNQFLGCLCVELGFNTHLHIWNPTYQKQIGDYVAEITEAKTQAQDEAEAAGGSRDDFSPDYWISVRPPPKCLPDIVESYVGAMFVDSEYDYSQVERFFDTHVKRYFTDMCIYDTYAKKHPTTFLTTFLQVNMGCMHWTVITKEIPSIDGSKPKTAALVIVHETVVAEGRAESGRYAKVAAAKKALEIMKGLPVVEFRAKYNCACRTADEGEVQEIGDLDLHGTAI